MRTLAAALTLLATAAQAAPPAVQFATPAQYPTGGGSPGWSETTVVAADFDSDGDVDVVSTDYFANGAPIVQLNLGAGTFAAPGLRLPAGANGIGTLAAGDFDGDGRVDLLGSNSRQILFLRGSGNGSFAAGASYSVFTGGQEDIVVLDANRDGKLDAVAIARTGFQVLLGNGDGTFTLPAAQTVAGIFPSAVDVARFNADAHPDLLLIDGGGQVIPLLGDGTGAFTAGSAGIATLILGTGLAGDFNGDGIDDAVALPEFNAGVRNAVVFLSDGNGGFVNPLGTYYDGGYAPVSGALADLNADGHLDIVASDTAGGRQVVLLGVGDGSFVQGGGFAASSSCQTPVVADFDLDGDTDIATVGVSGFSSGTLSVLRQLP